MTPPILFTFTSSSNRAYYNIDSVYIDETSLDSLDWLAGFNGNICVGSQQWNTNMCTGGICSIVIMGDDGSDMTDGYMLSGEFPSFKIYDASEDIYYNAIPSENFPFQNGSFDFFIDSINASDYYCNDNPSCIGCMDMNACNYDSNALIEDTCYYIESNLLQPDNNQLIEVENLNLNLIFLWSDINESCYQESLEYNIQISDSNNQIIVDELTQENNISIPYSDFNINEGEINSYSWAILIDDIISSNIFYFDLDATMLGIIDNKIDNFQIHQNYPNPFNPITYIEFDITSYNFLKINIYDTNGNFVEELVNDYYSPGSYKVYWDGSKFSSGIYFYEFQIDNQSFRKKMVLIK